jgi:hypothetical protein
MNSSLRLAGLVLALTAPTAVAEVWVVDQTGGPGSDFTAIQPAVNAAASGDLILVRPGIYAGFTVTAKGLEISAEFQSRFQLASGALVSVQNLTAQQGFALRGAEDLPNESGDTGARLRIRDCAGWVWVEDCHLTEPPSPLTYASTNGNAKLRFDDVGRAVVQRCDLTGGNGRSHSIIGDAGHPGLWAERVGSLAVHDCELRGGDGGFNLDSDGGPSGHGGAGLVLVSVPTTVLTGAVAVGGAGGSGTGEVCFGGASGGHGVEVQEPLFQEPPSGHLYVLDLDAVGGPGGGDFACGPPGDAPAGLAVSAPPQLLTVLPGAARTLQAASPVEEGQTLNLRLAGQAGDLATLGFGAAPAALPLPDFFGALLIGDAAPLVQFVGVVPASGFLVVPVPIPPLPGTVSNLSVLSQGVFVTPTLEVRLGGGTRVTLIPDNL